ncbi:hypothetical protein [Mahella australiensis]|uniref:Uncharacterized protein n=1 Tax=Mahella australiensis (strain DSM 15567 / CIP 107919 / 50-1 BON) TaxID=697281 RepID=F3ZVD8_MAHA5|nr:hypothetical protein [Mahella australiensis]AEE95288.1 hypothetical protein Mahau_0065 [Mahella australiensis 50-1 BON]
MIREAINRQLATIPEFGGRIYEAYMAPAKARAPYVTVKMASQRASTTISFAGENNIEVRIYGEPTSFKTLDVLEQKVIAALNEKYIADSTGNKYYTRWVPGGADYTEDERGLIVRLIYFAAGVLNERS